MVECSTSITTRVLRPGNDLLPPLLMTRLTSIIADSWTAGLFQFLLHIITTLCLNKKVYSFYFFRDNFPSCKLVQIIFGGNVAEKIWKKLTHGNFHICYALLVYVVTWYPFLSQFYNVKFITSHLRQFLRWRYCHRSFLQSVNHYKCH